MEAWNCDRLAMRLLFARLGVEYKGERRAEVFLRQVYQTADGRIKAFFTPPWLKEIKRMCDFEWREEEGAGSAPWPEPGPNG